MRPFEDKYHSEVRSIALLNAGYEIWRRVDSSGNHYTYWKYLKSDCIIACWSHSGHVNSCYKPIYLTPEGARNLELLLGPHGYALAKMYLAQQEKVT